MAKLVAVIIFGFILAGPHLADPWRSQTERVARAEAACAWVLWWESTTSSFSYRTADANVPGAKIYPQESHLWNILGSFTTNAACEDQQARKIGEVLKTWRKEKAEAKFGQHTITHGHLRLDP